MWSTIENFRESLSQITSEVLDAAEELESGGSEHPDPAAPLDTFSRRRLWQPQGGNHVSAQQNGEENHVLSTRSLAKGFLPKLKELQIHNKKLQAMEKDLVNELSVKNLAFTFLEDAHGKVLAEMDTMKEILKKEKEESSSVKIQLQRDRKFVEEANRDNKRLKLEKQKMSLEITELQRRLTEQLAEANKVKDYTRAEVLKEMEPIVSMKDEKTEELQGLLKKLEFENSQLQAEVKRIKQQNSWQKSAFPEEARAVGQAVQSNDSSKQAMDAAKTAQETFELEKKDLEKRYGAACAERDKAIRDLKRLKQHLIEKEQADSEKMEQDSKHITELEEKADGSMMRAMRLEQTLAQTLQKQEDMIKDYNERLEEANQEISNIKKKVAACVNALESKDGELLNLQAALGQYYAESEAKDRLHMELSAARKELDRLSDQLKIANNVMVMKDKEKEELLEKLALQQKKVSESQEQSHKLEADVLMLRRALEQSLTRLNRMSSDSDFYVDRRIAIKLLVTYFQWQQSKEVLDLMSRMLGFSEEDKQLIGLAQQGAGKGVVRGVLGLPGRVVGGLLKTSSSSSVPALSQMDNQSFSDLWIDFLLKESEEREKKDLKAAEASMSVNSQSSSSPDFHRLQESSYSDDHNRKGEAFSTPKFSRGSMPLENGPASRITEGDSNGSEFSNVPLNSTPSPSLVRSLLRPKDVIQRSNGQASV